MLIGGSMSRIAALILALASAGGPATSSASVNCRKMPAIITNGICTRHFGVGYHVITVAVPCAQLAPLAPQRVNDQRSAVQSWC
jgi:hypothetical protein